MYVCDSLENPGTKEYVNSEYYSFNHRDFVGALEWAQCGRFFIVLPIYKKYLKQNTDPNIQYELRPVERKN